MRERMSGPLSSLRSGRTHLAGRGPMPAGAILVGCALIVAAALPGSANAQGGPNPPPRQDTVSPAGVSLGTGAFNHNERDLSIGGGDFPAGLTLERSYLSNLASVHSAYSGYQTQGWNSNLNIRVGNSIVPTPWTQPPPGQENYLYSVSIGNRSIGFTGGSTNPTGGFVGTYQQIDIGGGLLEFSGGDHSTGHFTYTAFDGSVLVFNSVSPPYRGAMAVTSWTARDGTRADFTYDSDGLRSVINNRGFALLFEYGNVAGGRARTKACAVNMATTYVTALSPCPAGAQTVTYQYTAGSVGPMLTGFTNAAAQTTTYGYPVREHLGCITLPGQSGCQVSNVYGLCYPPPPADGEPQTIPPDMRTHEPVLSQTTATGETYTYSFPQEQECPPTPFMGFTNPGVLLGPVTMTASHTAGPPPGEAATTTLRLNSANVPGEITDALSRTTRYEYIGLESWTFMGGAPTTLSLVDRPEGNRIKYTYDSRGNITEERLVARPGSNQADIVRAASFPTSCLRTCDRPDYVIDAREKRTDFTYDPAHGGVLSETGPADANNERPQVRYTYEQRRAWIRNASGGYSPVATSVWVRTSERRCRNSRATGVPSSPCGIVDDEVVTTYDYGPDSGPNNLLLRGQVTTGGGLTARTCYGYDAEGNRISETGPGAQLASCP